MESAYNLSITRRDGTRLNRTTVNLSTAAEVIREIGLESPKEPTLYELSQESSPLLYLMADKKLIHMSLWETEESYHYLCDPSPKDAEFSDIGWNSFPSWTVTHSWTAAIRAASIYLKDRTLDPSLLWHHETA